MPLPLLVVVVFLVLATSAPAAPVEVVHQPLGCVPRSAHAVVSASASRIDDVATAELHFRRGDGGDWYVIPMFLDGEAWSARLPRPEAGLKDFEYRVVMTSTNLEPHALAPIKVRVDEACGTPAEATVMSPIVVRAPRGAAVLPAGFDPAGVVAADGGALPEDLDVKTGVWAKTVAGGAVVGGVAAIALGKSGEVSRELPADGSGDVDNPGFAFSHTVPPSGSVVATGATITLFVNMLREPLHPLDLRWRLDLSVSENSTRCATVEGLFSDARTPLGLVLVGPLRSTAACGDRYDVGVGRLVIFPDAGPWEVAGSHLYFEILPMSYHVEP